jgi:hypothetical protein
MSATQQQERLDMAKSTHEVVRGTVIHDDYLIRRDRLLLNGSDCGGDCTGGLEGWDNDRETTSRSGRRGDRSRHVGGTKHPRVGWSHDDLLGCAAAHGKPWPRHVSVGDRESGQPR